VAAEYGLDKHKLKLIATGPPAASEQAIASKKVDVIFTNTIKASEATGFINGHPNFDLNSIVNNDER
jgi:ABC-type nitrate/sulfonate/bicarbonate transport system substrate-binding protein